MTATNGSIWTTSVETLMPTSCSAVAIDSATPNSKEPMRTQMGRPRPSMAMTMAMNPVAAGHEGHEYPGRDDGHVAAAEASQSAGGTATAMVRIL